MKIIQEKLEQFGVEKFLEIIGAEHIRNMGGSIRSCCPIHKGDNDSAFSYYDGFFTCFSECQKSFSPASLLMEIYGISYQSALIKLGKILNYDFQDNEEEIALSTENLLNKSFIDEISDLKKTKDTNKIFDISNTDIYMPITQRYLLDEGFDNNVREYFDLRYCQIGDFKDRIIIPIDDKKGQIIGIAGRSILPFKTLEERNIPKYFFSKGLKKTETLYNISRIDKNLNYLIVVEGYKSVWRLYQWGFKNVVALMGASLKKEQKLLLLKQDLPIIVSGDNDKAGKILEEQCKRELSKFCPIRIFPIEEYAKNKKDSIAEIKREEFLSWIKKTSKKM